MHRNKYFNIYKLNIQFRMYFACIDLEKFTKAQTETLYNINNIQSIECAVPMNVYSECKQFDTVKVPISN